MKKLAILTVLATMLVPALASAQTPLQGRRMGVRPPVAMRHMRAEFRRGVRTGRINPAERARLQAEFQALRGRVQAMRQSGQPLTPQQRQEIRQQIKQLRQDLVAARRGR